MIRIIHDPGHGGKDSGAVAGDLIEKQLTWIIANAVILKLKQYDVESIVVQPSRHNPNISGREELEAVTNEANRLQDAAPVDLFISYHINAGKGTGFESFVHPYASPKSVEYQKTIHKHAAAYFKKHGMPDRGKKTANFHVLRETKMPAVLLECGFIDSPDAEKLKEPAFIDGLANVIVSGIVDALQLKKQNSDVDYLKEQAERYKQMYRQENKKVQEMEEVLKRTVFMLSKYV